MKLYHGSRVIEEKPVFGAGKATNDYGRSFYCMENRDLARELACPRRDDCFVNKYELPMNELEVLAERSGVNVRSIRQYEQIPDSISKAEAATVADLAKALGCGMEDLLPPRTGETE